MIKRRSARRGRRGAFIFLAAVLAVGCSQAPSPSVTRDANELIVAFPEGNVASDELGAAQFSGMLSQEFLISTDIDGRPVGRLAEMWQWENAGRTLRLRLRPGVSFHDGTLVSAPVVADILRRQVADPMRQGSYPSFADISRVRSEGELDLLIDLSQPSALLLEDLNVPLSVKPGVGAGPYRLLARDNSRMVFERYPGYYQGTPGIERVRLETVDALRTAWASLLRGDVDMVTNVPAEAVEFVRSDDIETVVYKRWFQFVVAFNSRRAPFTSPAVRRALNLAVNRDALIQRALRGYAVPGTGPLWPEHWAYDSSVSPYTHDPRLAAELLDASGYPLGAAGAASEVPGSRLRFTCLIPADFSILERIGLELQRQMYDVGIDMQFEVVPLGEYIKRLEGGAFQAVLVDMISGPGFARPYNFWRSAAGFKGLNVFGYENPEVERLFGLLRGSALNEAVTRSATHRLQRVFLEDPPALFLAWNHRLRAVRREFHVVAEKDRDPLLTLWRWTPNSAAMAAAR